MDYRTDQILNYLTTHDSYKIKIVNENSETKWLNITRDELLAIENTLALVKKAQETK